MVKKKLPKQIRAVLEEVKERLIKIYGRKLKGIILYGSYARGDFEDSSDIDIIILLEDMNEPIIERERYFDVIYELDLKYDTVISIVPFKEEDFKKRRLPIILNAKREGIFI
jgi:predicted nucleotidyltransferase